MSDEHTDYPLEMGARRSADGLNRLPLEERRHIALGLISRTQVSGRGWTALRTEADGLDDILDVRFALEWRDELAHDGKDGWVMVVNLRLARRVELVEVSGEITPSPG